MKKQNRRDWKRTTALLLAFAMISAQAGAALAEDVALDDGSPWVDYVLRENVEKVNERPGVRRTICISISIMTGLRQPRSAPVADRRTPLLRWPMKSGI